MKDKEKAVHYMRKMATGCKWRTLREIHYTKSDGSVIVVSPGIWYTGIPYTQGKERRRYSLLRFRLNLLVGVFFFRRALVGCDCSSAASFAWQKVKAEFPLLSTRKMLKDLCGRQLYLSHNKGYTLNVQTLTTKEMIAQNDISVMHRAYAALQVGDGLLQYDKTEKKGHIMLVSRPVGEDDVLHIIDQKGFGEGGSERIDTSWRVDLPYTIAQLMEEGYLPVYIKN